jgi:hypothetical protein
LSHKYTRAARQAKLADAAMAGTRQRPYPFTPPSKTRGCRDGRHAPAALIGKTPEKDVRGGSGGQAKLADAAMAGTHQRPSYRLA